MTGLTTWERHEAGLPPRDRDERARYREYDAASAPRTWVTEVGYPEPPKVLQALRSPKPERKAS